MPFTIQQLVASSPSRSSDGMFYSGKKIDTWFSVDIATGKKLPLLGNTDLDRICPIQSSNSLFIGRTGSYVYLLLIFETYVIFRLVWLLWKLMIEPGIYLFLFIYLFIFLEYNLIILDSKSSNRHWNITYYDYTSHSLTKDQTNNYGN